MPLSHAAQLIVDAAASRFPGSMTDTPVAQLRDMLAASAVPPTTAIHSTFDVVVHSPAGGVPVRVYRPSEAEGLPVLMWLHSGGFVVGNLDQNDEYLRKLSNRAGVVVVSVDYRLAPEHRYPAALEDARAVWEWIRGGPSVLGADCESAVTAGESAGGSLVFALGQQLLDESSPLPDAQISFYGSAETTVSNPECSTSLLSPRDCEWFWDQYLPDTALRSHPYASPSRAHNLRGLPPTFVATAEVDPTRDATEAYVRRLAEAGVDVEHERYDGVMHGFATMTGVLPSAAALFDKTVDYVGRKSKTAVIERSTGR